MELKKVNLVTKKNVLRQVEHTKLVPKSANIINKTCFVGLSYDLIYYLTLHYLKDNNEWFYDNSKYREIAFAMNYQKSSNEARVMDQKFLKRNQFFCHYYNFNELENLDILCGYENVVIADLSKNFDIDKIDSLIELENIVKRILKNGNKIYYLSPAFTFQAGSQIYNENSVANSESKFAIVAKFKFIDQYFSYLRDYRKYPIYRIVVPNYLNLFNYDFVANRTDVKKIDKTLRKIPNEPFFIDKVPFLSSDKLAESLYKFHLESLSKNYIINSDIGYNFHELNKSRPLYSKSDMQELKFKSGVQVDNYTQEWYDKTIKENLRAYFHNLENKSAFNKVHDLENKFTF